MSLTAAELIAYLRMDKSGFDKDLAGAERQMGRSEGKFKNWAKGMGTAAVETATAGAAATAGLATAVFATGVSYNTLQQRSRAALTTLLGGAEEANEQMDKLDAWAMNSPFAREVFYEAQQQLIGFGVEADNVIPIMDGVQNAVAAVGGTNEDITSVVDALANMQGTGRLSGEELRRLGRYGIDAAEIIGSEMGKTSEEIRDMASRPGGIPVDQVWEPLTAGLEDRFGGAAENVKDTMVGATDRIRAAFRDMGSDLAAPFVDPNGGGKAVDWANEFADVLRAVEQHVEPFTNMLMRRFEPAMLGVSASLKDAKDAVDSFDVSDLDSALDNLSNYAPAIAGVSGALLTMGTSNLPVIGRLASALGPIPAAISAAALASPEMRDALGELWDTARPLVDVLVDVAGIAAGVFTEGVGLAADALQVALDIIRPVVDAFDNLPGPIKTATGVLAAFIATRKLFPDFGSSFSGALGTMRTSVSNTVDTLGGWGGAFEGATNSTGDFRAAVSLAADGIGTSAKRGFRGAANGIMGLFGGPWGVALAGATVAIGYWAQKQAEARERADELRSSLDEQTGAFTENSDEIILNALESETWAGKNTSVLETAEELGISLQDLTGYIKGEEEATKNVTDALASWDELSDNVTAKTDPRVDAQQKFTDALTGVKDETQEIIDEEQTRLDQLQELRDATDDSKRAQEQYAEAVALASDETNTMEQRTRGLKDALDILNGVEKSAEEATRALYDSQQTLGEFIAGVAEESEGLATGLWDVDEGMIAVSEEGNRLNEMLGRHEDDMLAAAIAAYDKAGGDENAAEAAKAASDAYSDQVESLSDLLVESGWAEEEVAELIATMERTPEEIAFVVGSNASEAELEVIRLTNTIDALPDGDTHITDEGTSQDVINILKDLGYDVETLPDGRVEVTASGVDSTIEEIQSAARGPYNATLNVRPNIIASQLNQDALEEAYSGGRGSGVVRPRFHGGIDVKGMADGGLTPASVMDVAQMVAPGDIRFAGDRSDVDEAWIPLDGSRRSIAILQEAMARMPGFTAEGMAAGGVTGNLTPPSVESVDAPDTTELENVWQNAMTALEESTRSSFKQIESDTTASQSATTANTANQMTTMRDITAQQLALMVALTAQNMAAMDDATGQATGSMRDSAATDFNAMNTATGQATGIMRDNTSADFNTMRAIGSTQADQLRAQTATQFESLRAVGEAQTTALRTHSGREFGLMHTEGRSEAINLRSDAATQFTEMRDQGVDAAGDLRSGVVSEMGQTRSPFTSRVNDLVNVMRDFSSALNDAYGDMGVDVGTPTRLATGGIMPGYTPGLDVHKFASPTGGQLELSGGEAVMRPEFTRAVGPGWVHTMNAMARAGGVSAVRDAISGPKQSFATGGIVDEFTSDAKRIGREHKAQIPQNWIRPAGVQTIDDVIAGIEQHFETMMSGEGWVRPTSGRITSPYGASRGGYPHAGIDIAGGHGRVSSATAGIVRETGWNLGPGRTGKGVLVEHPGNLYTYSGHAPVGGIRVSPGDLVTTGQHISHQGSTGNSTGDHLHWEVHQMRPWNDVNPMPYWNAAGSGASSVAGGGGSDRWGGAVMQALRLTGLPTTGAYVNSWLRQIQTESGGNPNALQRVNDINMRMGSPARGLVQVIPPTFAAYSLPGMNNIMNPLHNLAAGMNYAKNRYGITGMLNAIGQGRGYELGTHYARNGWHMVGEAGPELVNFKGGEKVLNNRQTGQALAGPRLTMHEADLIGKAIARHSQSHGPTNITAIADGSDKLARTVAKSYRRETKRLARTS